MYTHIFDDSRLHTHPLIPHHPHSFPSSPPAARRGSESIRLTVYLYVRSSPDTRRHVATYACTIHDECADSSTSRLHRTTGARRVGRRARGRRIAPSRR